MPESKACKTAGFLPLFEANRRLQEVKVSERLEVQQEQEQQEQQQQQQQEQHLSGVTAAVLGETRTPRFLWCQGELGHPMCGLSGGFRIRMHPMPEAQSVWL